jgi:hypothetical protein
MVKKKYADADAITTKINELFEYRKITELIQIGQLARDKVFIRHLYHIQTQIYLLDAYLESHWELDPQQISQYWSGIMDSLAEIGYSGKRAEKLVREIRQYERIESDCRKQKWPTRVPFAEFYTTKSCDVRLIRHLVYEAAPTLASHWKETVWKYYDLITEINDDVNDVHEDVDTYNGNRYLISILRKGLPKTTKRYSRFIDKVTAKANAFFESHPSQEKDQHLHEWILTRAVETKALLNDAASTLDLDHMAKAKLLAYMP